MPDDADIAEAIERLYLVYKVETGLAQADAGQTVSQEEARRRMSRWLP
jgi:predicted transcriptional regulator